MGATGRGVLGREVVVYGLTSLLVQGATVVLTPVLTRVLGPTGYGAYELLQVSLNLCAIVVVLGVDLAVVKIFYDEEGLDHQRRVVNSGLAVVLATTVAATLAVLVCSRALSRSLLGTSGYQGAVVAAAVALPAVILMNFTTQALRIERRPWQYFVASGLGALVELVVVVVLLARTRAVGAVFVGLALGSLTSIVYAVWVSRHLYRPSVSPTMARGLLRFGAPLVLTGVSGWSVMFVDRLLLTRFVSLTEIGYYGLANKVALATNLVIYSFGAAWPPMVLGLAARDRPAATAVRAEMLDQFLVGVAMIGVPTAAFAPEIVRILAGPGYLPAARVVPVLVLAFLLFATLPVTQIAMMATDRTRALAAPSLVAAALNVVGCLVLCPHFGIAGAAWATVIGFGVQAIAYYVIAQRIDPVPYPLGKTLLLYVLLLPFLALGLWAPALGIGILVKAPLLLVLAASVLGLGIVDRHALVAAARSLRRGAVA